LSIALAWRSRLIEVDAVVVVVVVEVAVVVIMIAHVRKWGLVVESPLM